MNNKQLQLVNFEQSKRLKALGFDWETEYYDIDRYYCHESDCHWIEFDKISDGECYPFPTVALALKWFKDEKHLISLITYSFFDEKYMYQIEGGSHCGFFNSYEEAESALLDELLAISDKENAND